MLDIHGSDEVKDLGFDIPVCCGGDIHYITMYDGGRIVATTHENDPDDWLSQTIVDLTGEQRECDRTIYIITPHGTHRRLPLHEHVPEMFCTKLTNVPLCSIDLVQIMFNVTRDLLISMDSIIDKKLFRFAFNNMTLLGREIKKASDLYNRVSLKPSMSAYDKRKMTTISNELSFIKDRIQDELTNVSFLLDERKSTSEITETEWLLMKSYEMRVFNLPTMQIINGADNSINDRQYYVPSNFSEWRDHTLIGIRDYIYYSKNKEDRLGIGSETVTSFFTKTLNSHHTTFVHSMPKELLLARCEKRSI